MPNCVWIVPFLDGLQDRLWPELAPVYGAGVEMFTSFHDMKYCFTGGLALCIVVGAREQCIHVALACEKDSAERTEDEERRVVFSGPIGDLPVGMHKVEESYDGNIPAGEQKGDVLAGDLDLSLLEAKTGASRNTIQDVHVSIVGTFKLKEALGKPEFIRRTSHLRGVKESVEENDWWGCFEGLEEMLMDRAFMSIVSISNPLDRCLREAIREVLSSKTFQDLIRRDGDKKDRFERFKQSFQSFVV